jgi:hypothetical protein
LSDFATKHAVNPAAEDRPQPPSTSWRHPLKKYHFRMVTILKKSRDLVKAFQKNADKNYAWSIACSTLPLCDLCENNRKIR